MEPRTPLTLITGPLGSGKTTLLRHILEVVPQKLAILMNEFGEIAIDSQIIEGKNIRIADLGGGCVCCSLLGEFEAAVSEVTRGLLVPLSLFDRFYGFALGAVDTRNSSYLVLFTAAFLGFTFFALDARRWRGLR